MQHEVFAVVIGQAIDDLLVLTGAERGRTMAWVSPRVNRAEPCERGKMPTSEAIARTVLVSRPSMRVPVSKMSLRTISFSSS